MQANQKADNRSISQEKAKEILKYLQNKKMYFCWYDGVMYDVEYLQEVLGLI
jgi:hypothetical protein